MTFKPITAALLHAFGLGKTHQVVSEQRASMAEVRAASTQVHLEADKIVAAVVFATDQAAEFDHA